MTVIGLDQDGFDRARRFVRQVETSPRNPRLHDRLVPIMGKRDNHGFPHDCCSPCNPFECADVGIAFDDCAAYPTGVNGWEVNFGAMFEDCCPGAGGKQWLTYHGNCEFWGPDLACTAYSPTQWILTIRDGKKSTLVLDLGGAGQVVFRSVRNWCRQCPNEMRLCGPVPACVRHYLGTVCVYPKNSIPHVCCTDFLSDADTPAEYEFQITGLSGNACCEALNGHWVLTWIGNFPIDTSNYPTTDAQGPGYQSPTIPGCTVGNQVSRWGMGVFLGADGILMWGLGVAGGGYPATVSLSYQAPCPQPACGNGIVFSRVPPHQGPLGEPIDPTFGCGDHYPEFISVFPVL